MSKMRMFVSTAVAVVILATGLWWIMKPSGEPASAPAVAVAEKKHPASQTAAVSPSTAASAADTRKFPASKPASPASEMISSIIATPNADNASIVDQLLTLLPNLSGPDQAEAAHHIANLSDDKEAGRWIPGVVAWKLPAPAAEVLFRDLANRPPSVTMPAMAAMADNPNHPKQQASEEILEVLYDNPEQGSTWSQVVSEQLKSKGAVSSSVQ